MENPHQLDFISVVVPVYNEEGCLRELLDRTLSVMRATGKKFEFILIDDGSRDASGQIIEEYAQNNPEVVGVILNRNYGQHSAIMAGFSQVRGDLVITLDADLQNPPEEIPNLISAAEQGNDVVGTIRQNRHDTVFRRYASKMVNCAARAATGVHMNDYGCMLRAYRRHVVDAMLQCHEHSTFIPVLGNSFARNTCEIPVAHAARSVGESKYSFRKLIDLQFNLLTCMTTFPLRVLAYFGIVSGIGGFLLSLYILVRRFMPHGDAWANFGNFVMFAVIFFLMGIQMIGIGIIGEYIGKIYNDVRARPAYFIERIVRRDEK